MKYFKILLVSIIILFLCHGFSFCAENWMSQSDIVKKNQGLRGISVYQDQGRCQTEKSEVCYQIDSCSPSFCKPTDVEVDDTDKPIWATPENVQNCTTVELCQSLIDTKEIDNPSYNPEDPESPAKIWQFYCTNQESGYIPFYKAKGEIFEAYCTKITGYEKKIIQELREDATLKEAYLLAKANKEQLETDEINALKGARDNWDSLDTTGKMLAIKKLFKRLVKD